MIETGRRPRSLSRNCCLGIGRQTGATTTPLLITSLVCLESVLDRFPLFDLPPTRLPSSVIYALLLEAVAQQALVETTASKEAQDTLPVEFFGVRRQRHKDFCLDRAARSSSGVPMAFWRGALLPRMTRQTGRWPN